MKLVMLAGGGESTHILHHALAEEFAIERVIVEQPVPRVEFLRRRAKKLGLRTVAGQVLFQGLLVPALRAEAKARVAEIKSTLGLSDAPIDPARVSHVSSVNADETIALLQRLRPDVVVVNGTRIISKRVLAATPATFLNTHAGITPLYRGVHGGYWALVEKQTERCGVTVHVVDAGIDTGDIVGQAVIRTEARDNFVTYPYLQLAAAIPILKQAIRDASAGTLERQRPPTGASRLWSHPTLAQYLWERLRNGVR